MSYQSTKKFGPITTTHRNWHAAENENRNSRKCSLIHGYSRYVEVTFQGELDNHGWVYDFGLCKEMKQLLEDNWDHKVLIASDDPELPYLLEAQERGLMDVTIMNILHGWTPAIEGSAKWCFDKFQEIVDKYTDGRVQIVKVQVWEHENNSASYVRSMK